MARHNILGKIGEDAASDYLIKNGYIIRERNWRLDKLEVDIIAEKDKCIIIVEVKTRSFDAHSALIAIDKRKQAFLMRAANAYVKGLPYEYGVRIDVICIEGDGLSDFKVDHIIDAVRPRVRTSKGRRIK